MPFISSNQTQNYTFATQGAAPFVAGNSIKIVSSGVTYSYIVDSCTTSTVTLTIVGSVSIGALIYLPFDYTTFGVANYFMTLVLEYGDEAGQH